MKKHALSQTPCLELRDLGRRTSGTDPNDRASVLKISQMEAGGNDMLASFPAVSAKQRRPSGNPAFQAPQPFLP